MSNLINTKFIGKKAINHRNLESYRTFFNLRFPPNDTDSDRGGFFSILMDTTDAPFIENKQTSRMVVCFSTETERRVQAGNKWNPDHWVIMLDLEAEYPQHLKRLYRKVFAQYKCNLDTYYGSRDVYDIPILLVQDLLDVQNEDEFLKIIESELLKDPVARKKLAKDMQKAAKTGHQDVDFCW